MTIRVRESGDRFSRGAVALLGGEIALSDAHQAATPCLRLTEEQRARLFSVVRLLETAGQYLPRENNQAYRCVAKATALLQAECELGAVSRQLASPRDLLPAWKMKRVISYVEANLDRRIRIEETAAIAKLSCSHFSRVFRSTTGEPFSSFVLRRRTERAEQLILLTDKPLSQIALDCGMADQSHLTKMFRRLYGVSPGRWRKLQHGSETFPVEQEPNEDPASACSSGLYAAVAA
jgi:AraC family transcriptional regulator